MPGWQAHLHVEIGAVGWVSLKSSTVKTHILYMQNVDNGMGTLVMQVCFQKSQSKMRVLTFCVVLLQRQHSTQVYHRYAVLTVSAAVSTQPEGLWTSPDLNIAHSSEFPAKR